MKRTPKLNKPIKKPRKRTAKTHAPSYLSNANNPHKGAISKASGATPPPVVIDPAPLLSNNSNKPEHDWRSKLIRYCMEVIHPKNPLLAYAIIISVLLFLGGAWWYKESLKHDVVFAMIEIAKAIFFYWVS